MTRTMIELDDDALAAAAAELGTKTKVATVNQALQEIAARRRSRAFLTLLDDLDLQLDADTMDEAWR